MIKDKYIFPAIFSYVEDGVSVEFPDLPGCYTCADSTEEALRMAKDALGLHIYGMEQDDEKVPLPSPINSLKLEKGQVVVLVETWMPLIRNIVENRAVKKTLTIPKWLNDMAESNNVNFSHVLQTAPKDYLGVDRYREYFHIFSCFRVIS